MPPTTRWPMSRRAWLRWMALAGLSSAGGALGSGCARGDGGGASAAETDLDAFVSALSLDDKLELVSGAPVTIGALLSTLLVYNQVPIESGSLPERGVPSVAFTDGPRGVVMYRSTCFPVAMARGASFDPELEARVGDAIGVEARAQGANLFAGVCVNLLRHPAWGRAQECFGEDPVLTAAMGVALLGGAQRHVMGCVKHFACNSIEDSRFFVNVTIGERALHEVYLPHFKACVDAGAASVMSAYNKLNGEFCGQNHTLLTDILKDQWGFAGFVMSDFVFGVRDGVAAMNAGLDLEMPLAIHYGPRLASAVQGGAVPQAQLDDAVKRIVRQHRRFAAVGEPERYQQSAVAGPEHAALARRVASDGMVLLRNEPAGGASPLLPLDAAALRRVAVVGRLISAPNLGDEGSSRVRPPYVITPLAGIAEALPQAEIIAVEGASLAGHEDAIAASDAVIAVVGYSHEDEGENVFIKGGDRPSLRLRADDEALLLDAVRLNPRTVAVVVTGSAIVSEAWRDTVPAILVVWYPGMEGGRALADVLLGTAHPGGRLPCVFPRSEDDLPPFDSAASEVEYGLFHGYRWLDRNGVAPAFPFGFGLGYTTFSLSDLELAAASVGHRDELVVSATVTNTGTRAGAEVIQVYVEPPAAAVERAPRELRGFQKVQLAAGESAPVAIRIAVAGLGYWDEAVHGFVVERGDYVARVGTSSRDADLARLPFRVT